MGRIVARVQVLALALGAPGLFLVAFLDSSFLSLPEIADLLVVWMVTQHKARMLLYVASATVGSVAGCLLMYFIGRKGGDVLIRKRFHSGAVDRAMGAFRRHGMLAVLIPAILPPPAPFKIFVLLAGVAGIDVWRFIAAVTIGRGVRYFVEGLLAVRYGDRAIAYIHTNGRNISLAVVTLIVIGFCGYLLWRKRTKTSGADRIS
jgi:membrane protein YqaA with SNARE-associated domain